MSKTYIGERKKDRVEVVVTMNVPYGMAPLNPRHDLYNHSPCGFEYGYGGSGPAQLALAILADHLADHPDEVAMVNRSYELDSWIGEGPKAHERAALCLHQAYKFAALGGLPREKPFCITTAQVSANVAEICAARQEARAI